MRLLRADSKFFLLLLVIAGIFLNSCKKRTQMTNVLIVQQ